MVMLQPALSPPSGVEPRRYNLCLLGPLALGLSLGMQVIMTAFLLLGPASNPGLSVGLTEYGRKIVHPEHDLLIYTGGVFLVLAAALLAMGRWQHKLARVEASRLPELMTSSALLEGLLAVTSLAVYAALLTSDWFSRDFRTASPGFRPPMNASDAITMLVSGAVALICAALDRQSSFRQPVRSNSLSRQRRLRLNGFLRYATPVFIILAVGVPPGTWPRLAGQIFLIDSCHHLKFIQGPTPARGHGMLPCFTWL